MDGLFYAFGYIFGGISVRLLMHWPWTVLLVLTAIVKPRWIMLLPVLFLVSIADFVLGLYDYVSGPTGETIFSRCVASVIALGAGLMIRAVIGRLAGRRSSTQFSTFD